jgi:hypothetical protein
MPILLSDVRSSAIVMQIFRILPVTHGVTNGWVVETTHENGVVETSVVFATREEAQAAADSWIHLDEDWAAI